MHSLRAEVLSSHRTRLGESPRWDGPSQLIRWVDIDAGDLLTVGIDGGRPEITPMGVPLGALVLADDGTTLVAVGDAWRRLDGAGVATSVGSIDQPEMRFNDGGVDVAGRLWSATMRRDETMPSPPQGNLYRVDERGLTLEYRGLIAGNGIAWSGDDRRLFIVDSGSGHVLSFGYDAHDGVLVGEPDASLRVETGMADGIACDVDGGVWVACWGSGLITRYGPDGKATHRVEVPVNNVTAATFAGPDLATLIISTASRGDLTNPLAGSLFAVDVGFGGVPLHAASWRTWQLPAEL